MSWQTIARQDGHVTVGTRSGKLLLGLTALSILLSAYVYPVLGTEPITTARFGGYVRGWLTTVLPFVGVLLGYGAVVGERESGALRLSLSLPHSRLDLLFGKFCSRAGLLTGVLVGALTVAGALVVYPFGELVLGRFLVFVLLTVLFGVLWCGLGLATSLVVATRRRALVLAFGLVFLFVIVWDLVAAALRAGLDAAGVIDGRLPGPAQFLIGIEPGHVFGRVVTGLVQGEPVSGPWYLNEWVALVLLVLWSVGPLAVAYGTFVRRDIA
ncbi:ABC transporter permease subunit [Haloarcula salinisoli]|uniref:ABC transporter permease n=1 Tax=Haloarcula salinisoli TaxID=2487746 RepID=A0A8J7YGU2_9EURY|nr:ABC transporter permease subunit [Halomicroarcula salinisoli]MBX0305690.1 ABC transporter permease [Halomicroarcula salinisoli]